MARVTKGMRVSCWIINNGNTFEAECAVGCGTKITPFNYEAGHIEAAANGGQNTIENLKPICSTCNKSMATRNMVEYIRASGYSPKWLRSEAILSPKHRLFKVTSSTNYKILTETGQYVIYELPPFLEIPWIDISGKLEVCIDGNMVSKPLCEVYDYVFRIKPRWECIVQSAMSEGLASGLKILAHAIEDYDLDEASYDCESPICMRSVKAIMKLGDITIRHGVVVEFTFTKIVQPDEISDYIGHNISFLNNREQRLEFMLKHGINVTRLKASKVIDLCDC